VHGSVAEDVEYAPVGECEVDLDVVGVPLVSHGLDSDAGYAETAAGVPDPGVHRFAGLRVVGLVGPDVFPGIAQAARDIDSHDWTFGAVQVVMRST
jgi:hypothetical protein